MLSAQQHQRPGMRVPGVQGVTSRLMIGPRIPLAPPPPPPPYPGPPPPYPGPMQVRLQIAHSQFIIRALP